MFSQLAALTTTKLTPPSTRAWVKSMYLLGEAHFVQGFLLRPRSEYQEETVIQCQLYIKSGRAMPNQMGVPPCTPQIIFFNHF